jgi:hypothetical protein
MKMAVLRKSAQTGLKATSYTQLLKVQGRGALRSIYWTDPDNATQTETLRITVDGDVVLDGGKDVPNTWEFLGLIKSVMANTPTAITDDHVIDTQRIPFHDSLLVEYKRAATQTTGLSITITYENKCWM